MRIVRFLSNGKIHFGQRVDQRTALRIDGPVPGLFRVTEQALRIDKLLAPIVPTDILCIGLNYREHARESNSTIPDHPMLFIKAGNTLNNPLDPIHIPRNSSKIDFEAELAVVIGRDARHVPAERVGEYILGYTIANDVSARDWQHDPRLGGGQFARGKSFDGFCPLGPEIVTADEVRTPNNLRLRSLLNGRLMQDDTTADMIFNVPALIESVSSTMTLRAGSVLLTGTPSGVGGARKPPVFMRAGDTIAIEIDGIGRLENPVVDER